MGNSSELYLSLAAICISIISLIYSILFKKRDYESRRAYLTPAINPGSFNLKEFESNFEIVLVNSGTNPVTKIVAKIKLYNINTKLIFDLENAYSNNPLPANDHFHYKFDFKKFPYPAIKQIHYVKIKLDYYDEALKKKFNGEFIWELNASNDFGIYNLFECSKDIYQKLKDNDESLKLK